MPPNVKVCINGFVLSTLLFDCTNNSGDKEGFLCGSVTRNMRREISDHSMSNTQEDIVISICSTVPCGNILSFYNSVGELKKEEIDCNLGDRIENVVGWYRFRRYSAMHPSAREQVIHKNLQSEFANFTKIDNSYFVFAVLSASNLSNFATHSYDYAFFIHRPQNNQFRDLPLTILNLGDTRNSYRSGSMALPFMNSSSFNSVLQSSGGFDFSCFYETENQVNDLHQRLRMKLDTLQQELAASDAINETFEDSIQRLTLDLQTLLATQESQERETRLRTTLIQQLEQIEGADTLLRSSDEFVDNNSEKDLSKSGTAALGELETSQKKTPASEKGSEDQESKQPEIEKKFGNYESSTRVEEIECIDTTAGSLISNQEFMEYLEDQSDKTSSRELDISLKMTSASDKGLKNQELKEQEQEKIVRDYECSFTEVHTNVSAGTTQTDDSESNECRTVESVKSRNGSGGALQNQKLRKKGVKNSGFSVSRESEQSDSMEYDSSESSDEKENPSSLKRASDSDMRSTKRACLDKYFENGEDLDDKTSSKTVGPISSSSKQKVISNSQLLVLDPDCEKTSSTQDASDDIKSKNLATETEENIPSPASNVEIGSEAELQVYESVVVDESISSSHEFLDSKDEDAKESISMQCIDEISVELGMKKSLSDSTICSFKGVSPDRCASAQANIVSQMTEVRLKDDSGLIADKSTTVDKNALAFASVSSPRFGSTDESSSKVNPPFIIYAFKESENGTKVHKSDENSVQSNMAHKVSSELLSETSVVSPSDEPKVENDLTVDPDKKNE